jgi:hypothetical protein
MKKPSFDTGKLKEFFVLNVEKMVLGLGAVGAVWLSYSAMQHAPYDKQPEDLQKQVQEANRHMEATVWDPKRENIKPPRFRQIAARANEQVPLTGYAYNRVFYDNKIINEGTKRDMPELLAAREPEVYPGLGPFAMHNPNPQQGTETSPDGEDPARGSPDGGPSKKQPKGGKGKGGNLGGFLTGQQGQGGEGGGGQGGVGPGGLGPGGLGPGGLGPGGLGPGGLGPGGLGPGGLGPGGLGPGGLGPGGLGPGGLGPGGFGQGGFGEGGEGSGPQGVQAPPESLVKGVQWVSVTAAFPIKEQFAKYAAVFDDARYKNPNLDIPVILGYRVERAEVLDSADQDPDDLKWVALAPVANSIKKALNEWAVVAPEVVDPGYTHPDLTFPLGPLLGKNWGRSVAHAKIPLMKIGQTQEETTGRERTTETPGSEEEFFNERASGSGAAGAQGEGGYGPGGYGPGGSSPDGGRTGPGGFRGGGLGPGGVGPGGLGPGGLGPGGLGPGGLGPGGRQGGYGGEGGYGGYGGISSVTNPEYYLVRYFDFTVEEGKRYRYRFQLVFKNPNHGVSSQHLKDAALAKDSYKFGPWSDPSPVVSISNFTSILAGAVKPPQGVEEAQANAILIQYDRTRGVKAIYECRKKNGPKDDHDDDPLVRGKVIHFKRKVDVINPLTHHPTVEEVDFLSKALVVDLKGGESLAPSNSRDRDKEPGEIVLLDVNGTLVVKSELADAAEYKRELDSINWLKQQREQSTTGGYPGGSPEGGEGGRPGFPRGKGSGS